MEVKDAEKKMIIAKPIPIKPSSSKLQSLSSYTASGPINNSLPSSSSQAAVAAIRPTTVRLKPAASWSTTAVALSESEASGTAPCYLADPILQPEIRSSVVYKPLAKPVSRNAVFLLAEMGNSDRSHPSAIKQMHTQVQHPSQPKHHFRTPVTPDFHRKVDSTMGINQITDSAKVISQKIEEKQKAMLPTTSGDRPSYDGYNWRKYGQKQVKGSEYPRSYYKCTHPNCPVKKKVERSLDGQIAEIVYKGEHNHPKPQPPKRHSSGVPDQQGFVSHDGAVQDIGNLLLSNSFGERYEGSEGRMEHHNRVGFSVNPSYPGKGPMVFDAAISGTFTSSLGTTDNSCGLSCSEDGSRKDAEDDEPHTKRRRNEHEPSYEVVPQAIREPRIVLEGTTDAEIFGDGFRWRKYGQKVVKGNPYPRSYYRCSSLKCNVRKHVERSLDDPTTFITTYEGKHNHEMPVTRSSNTIASDPISASPSKKARQ